MELQPPKSKEAALNEMNSLRAELDTGKVPRWRRDVLEARLNYLRGWLHGTGSLKDNITEDGS